MEIMEVLDQVPPQDASRVRVQLHHTIHHMRIHTARLSEIRRIGINDVVIDLSIRIAPREPRVGRDDYVDAFVGRGLTRSVEVGWEPHIPEKRCGSVHGEFTIGCCSSVDEEGDGEDGLAVRSDIANVLE